MGQGWIKLHRKIRECSVIWDDKPFSRGQAWIDLLMMANHEAKDIFFDGGVYRVERGQQLTSIRKLSEIWGWSRTKTTKFLNDLKKAEMVSFKSDTKKTVITIVNYDNYQDAEIQKEPQKSHEQATEKPQKDTNKNDKELKNDKENNINGQAEEMFERIWQLYPFMKRGKGSVSKTQRQKLFKIGEQQMIGCISRFAEENKGKDPQYVMRGSTFFNSGYVDYLDENYIQLEHDAPLQKPSVVHTDHGDYEVVTLDDM